MFGRPIGQNQGIQFPLARAYAQMRAAAKTSGVHPLQGHALPNCLRSSSFARINVFLREAGRFLPARLM